MKKLTVRILCSTGITLIVSALAGILSGARFLCISSVLESFAVNIIIHFGFLFTRKFESNYAIIEVIIDLSYTIVVLIGFSVVFGWFSTTPIWILIIIAIVVYTVGIILSITRMRQNIEEINVLLRKRNNKTSFKTKNK